MPVPNYGYGRSSGIFRARIDNIIYNDWVDGNLDELVYVDRQAGGSKHRIINVPTGARTKVCGSITYEVYAMS